MSKRATLTLNSVDRRRWYGQGKVWSPADGGTAEPAPKVSAEFVAHMEDVLDLYAQPYDPRRPVVCFDETSTQLLADTRPPLPAQPGRPARQDYEYRREGTRNLFLTCEPMAGWRHVQVTERRTMQDFARPDALAGG